MDEPELYGVGGWEASSPEQLNLLQQAAMRVQQLSDLHLPNCPTKLILLDQCAHCCPSYCYSVEYTSTPLLYHGGDFESAEQQRMQQEYTRSYAAVVASPRTQSPALQQPVDTYAHLNETGMQPPVRRLQPGLRQVIDPVPARSSTPSWAEVASDPNRPRVPQYKVHLQRDSSFVHLQPRSHPVERQYPWSPAEDSSRSGLVRPHREFHSAPQTVQPSTYLGPIDATTQSAPDGYSNMHSPVRYQQDHTMLGMNPCSIDMFVQQTTFGGHRDEQQSTPRTLNIPSTSSDPYPPTSPSIASSRGSKASSRRKGSEMKDARYRFECPECLNRFPRNEDLRRHMNRSHTAVSGRPHKCSHSGCSWAFVNPKDLHRHLATHALSRQKITCPFQPCSKTYTRNDNLQRHVNRDHEVDSAYLSMSRTTSSHTSYSQNLFE